MWASNSTGRDDYSIDRAHGAGMIHKVEAIGIFVPSWVHGGMDSARTVAGLLVQHRSRGFEVEADELGVDGLPLPEVGSLAADEIGGRIEQPRLLIACDKCVEVLDPEKHPGKEVLVDRE